jgi:hypothetical protein
MKVILETYHANLIQYLHLYWCEVPYEDYFNLHKVPCINTNVDIVLSVNETFLE